MKKRFLKKMRKQNATKRVVGENESFQNTKIRLMEESSDSMSPSARSRISQQMEGPEMEDYEEPIPLESEIPIQALAEPDVLEPIPPIQAFAEPALVGVEMKFGWETSLLNLHNITQVAEVLSRSNQVMIFTGAGVSMESIKPTPGLTPLSRTTALQLLERRYYEILQSPEKDVFLQTYLFGSILKILEARAGAGHYAIADLIQILRKKGRIVHLVTQNVDYLHEKAAIETNLDPSIVNHIHGWVKTATCPRCHRVHDYKERLIQLKQQDNIDLLLCSGEFGRGCNGVLTPDIVEYGEQVPKYDEYYNMAKHCDAIIVAGTSLKVTPANQLVNIVHNRGGKVIVFDLYSTRMENITDIHVQAQLQYALPLLLWKLDEHIPITPLGITDQLVTYKYWGDFFENWTSIGLNHPTKTLDERIELFKEKFKHGLVDPIWKIHHL